MRNPYILNMFYVLPQATIHDLVDGCLRGTIHDLADDIRVPTSLLEAFDAGPAYIVSNISSANLAVARQTRSRSRKALASAATDPQQEAAMLQAGAAAGPEA